MAAFGAAGDRGAASRPPGGASWPSELIERSRESPPRRRWFGIVIAATHPRPAQGRAGSWCARWERIGSAMSSSTAARGQAGRLGSAGGRGRGAVGRRLGGRGEQWGDGGKCAVRDFGGAVGDFSPRCARQGGSGRSGRGRLREWPGEAGRALSRACGRAGWARSGRRLSGAGREPRPG